MLTLIVLVLIFGAGATIVAGALASIIFPILIIAVIWSVLAGIFGGRGDHN